MPASAELIVVTPTGSLRAELELKETRGRLELPTALQQRYREYVALAKPGMPVLVLLRTGLHTGNWLRLTLP